MRILGLMVMVMCLGMGVAFGSTVDLTDGRTVQGVIVQQDNKSIQIDVDGITMTYYADEIKDIDGKDFAPAPAVQAVAVANLPSVVAPSEPAAPDLDKRALILKFIDVFGTRQALNSNFQLMVSQIEKQKPDEAQKIRQRVKVDEIIDRLVPIYDRNFSSEDLKAFIAFYGSEEGQKLLHTIPELMKESVKESVKYMEEKFPEVKTGH